MKLKKTKDNKNGKKPQRKLKKKNMLMNGIGKKRVKT